MAPTLHYELSMPQLSLETRLFPFVSGLDHHGSEIWRIRQFISHGLGPIWGTAQYELRLTRWVTGKICGKNDIDQNYLWHSPTHLFSAGSMWLHCLTQINLSGPCKISTSWLKCTYQEFVSMYDVWRTTILSELSATQACCHILECLRVGFGCV